MKTEIVRNGAVYNKDMTELIKILPEFRNTKFISPKTVKHIHSKAFENCDIEEIHFWNAEIIDDDACFNCQKLKSVNFGTAVKISPKALSFCESVENITVSETNRKYKSIDGVLFNGTVLHTFPCDRKGSYVVPDGTTEIADCAFYFSQLSEITFPDTLTTIGDLAFEKSELEKINFSKRPISIGFRAFSCCENLNEISLADNSNVADCAFIICSSLKKVNYNPDSVTIGKNAFQHTPFYDSFYEGLTATDISDLNIGNIEDMSKEELEKLISSIEDADCKIITLENADEFLSDIKVTPNGTMLFPQDD